MDGTQLLNWLQNFSVSLGIFAKNIKFIWKHAVIVIVFCLHFNYKQSGYLKHNLQELLGLFKKIYPNEEAPIEPEEDQTFVTEEYRIPTCSYRMGVPNMAYAVVTIGKDIPNW